MHLVQPEVFPLKKIKLKRKKVKSVEEIDYAFLDINEDFRMVLNLVENTNKNLFITGKAGTGKSTLLKLIKEISKKEFAVIAPTGIAALNIKGQTIHSFFKFPLNLMTDQKIKKVRDTRMMDSLELLIIDEISMVRADLMDAIDRSLRLNRCIDAPFGGLQLILFGDMFQLPPVVKGRDLESFFDDTYGGPYFFNSTVFKNCKLDIIELKKIYRQADEIFINDLNRIRERRIDGQLLGRINNTLCCNVKSNDQYVILTTTNMNVNFINEYELSKIDKEEYKYEAIVKGKFGEDAFPTEYSLVLKAGAQIILIKNDPKKRWVNGTIATISYLDEDYIKVKIKNREYKVNKEKWENFEYHYDEENGKIEEKVVGTFDQFPVRLAWALTIHKSQGQTFDRAIIDLSNGAFAHGQTYVALSRCRRTEGIILTRPITPADIIVDERVYDVYSMFDLIN